MSHIIVFIHGIGSSGDTWDHFIKTTNIDNKICDICEYIPNITNVEKDKTYYYLYEYKSKIVNGPKLINNITKKISGTKNDGEISIAEHSKTFEHDLENLVDLFTKIDIVAHSMGGIISMNMLFNIINNNFKLVKLISNCILFGSPLNGSNEPKELKKLLKLDISTDILNELKPESETIKSLQQNIQNKSIEIKSNFNILYIAGDADSRIIGVDEKTINKFGVYAQISGGHSEIIQTSLSSSSFIKFKNFLFESKPVKYVNNNQTTFQLNNKYLTNINDTGIKLSHQNKNEIYIDDIFIFQDLQDLTDKKKVKINSQKLLDIYKFSKCIVFGEEVSGLTSLAHMIQKKLNEENLIPICFNGKNIKKSDYDTFKNRMYLNLRNQYSEVERDNLDAFIHDNKERLVIIIDNLENLVIKNIDAKARFFKMLNENFEYILLFSNDSFEMEAMTKDEIRSELMDFDFLKIKEYGHILRDKMIEKWVTIGEEETIEVNNLIEKKEDISKTIETIIGNKFIPTYPLFIISLLQQIEAGTNNNLGGSAYAEFYNYLINQSLGSTNIKPDELDYYHTFLSYIAYYYFKNTRKELDKKEIEEVHGKYSVEVHMKPFSMVMNNLIDAKLIKEDNGFYIFGHNYVYYSFVAKYMSDNMDKRKKKNEVQEVLSMLIKRLHRTEFANIIIFLIHHSKTRAEHIIDEVICEARSLFSDIAPTTLAKQELITINELINEEIKVIIDDKKPQKHREELLTMKDEVADKCELEDNEEIVAYDEKLEDLDIFSKLNLSSKLMEILGQIAKNYYGSLDQEDKFEIINESTQLGLRNLNWFLKQFSEYRDLLEKDIRDKIEKKDIISKSEIEKVTKRIIFDFAEIISIHFIKKISTSVASKNLLETIENLVKADNNEVMKIIDIAVKLQFQNGLNTEKILLLNKELEDNLMAKELLKYFVIEHLYKFDINYKKKQEVCAKLDIGIENQKNMLVNKSSK